ncbi:hypothetical protein [Psychrobacillus sp. BM2]|uniref:hypothetical protein n=1 Tax=Psychrobacillus sp. BM2 TaxID=3400421 RepID=UPI003B02C141
MSKIATKYQFILDMLSSIGARVYTGKASDKATYPYAVINITTSNNLDEQSDGLFLDVDVWDIEKGANYDAFFAIENLTDLIDSKLNYLRANDSEHGYIVNQINRLTITDENDSIERRKLKYYVKTYNRY